MMYNMIMFRQIQINLSVVYKSEQNNVGVVSCFLVHWK